MLGRQHLLSVSCVILTRAVIEESPNVNSCAVAVRIAGLDILVMLLLRIISKLNDNTTLTVLISVLEIGTDDTEYSIEVGLQ